MVMTTQWRSLLCGLVLVLGLMAGLGCTRAETAMPLSSAETADSLGGGSSEASPAPLAGSSVFQSDATDGLGAFPTFMPSVAQGSDSQECQLGTDPYSTCI
jgi:hypothetical protein